METMIKFELSCKMSVSQFRDKNMTILNIFIFSLENRNIFFDFF
jgi:hypothetical protein